MGFDATFQQLLGTTPPGLLGQALIHAETVDPMPSPDGSTLDRAAVEFLLDEHGADLTFAGCTIRSGSARTRSCRSPKPRS